MKFTPAICEAHSREVSVTYSGFDQRTGIHEFRVSSLSRPLTHIVQVRVSDRFHSNETPESLLTKGLVRVYSSDEFFTYGGCAYNTTRFNSAIYPEFRVPRTPDHDYLCSHTLLAVLDTICRIGPNELEESFSRVLTFNESTNHYDDLQK